MSTYLLHKSHEPALVALFKDSKFRPEVEAITNSDMMSTAGTIYESRFKLTFTTKSGPYIKLLMYIPGCSLQEQYQLSDTDKGHVAQWLNDIVLSVK